MPSIAELMAQKAEIEKQIADVQREARAGAIAQIRDLMAQYGLSLADLNTRAAPAGRRVQGPRAGGKVAAKYRDPASGREWTGRGLKPKWLATALADGKSLQDFAI